MTLSLVFNKQKRRLLLILSIIGSACLVYFFIHQYTYDRVLTEQKDSLIQSLKTNKVQFKQHVTLHRSKLLFLYSTLPEEGITALSEKSLNPEWVNRLTKIGIAYLQNNEEIKQFRLIKNNDAGKEQLKIFQTGGQVKITNNDFLQNKGNRFYFNKTMSLQRGQEYISEITLNREYGEVEYPTWPTYRIGRPIFDDQNKVYGLMMINIDASQLLNNIKHNVNEFVHTNVLNSNGQYLVAENPNLEFAHELKNINNQWSTVTGLKTIPSDETIKRLLINDEQHWVIGSKIWLTSNHSEQRFVYLLQSFSEQDIQNRYGKTRFIIISFISLITFALILILGWYQHHIEQLTELNKNHSRFKAIVLGSSDAMIGIDIDGHINNWNPAASYLFGIKVSVALKSHFSDVIKSYTRSSQNKLKKALVAALHNGKTSTFEVSEKQKKLDRVLLFHLYSVSDINNPSHVIGAAAVIRDITELSQSQSKIAQLNESLEAKVKERTAQLQAEKFRADHANHAKSEFVANIAHEIRTPLNGISGVVELISSEALSPKQKYFTKLAKNSVTTLSILINDLLDMSKIEAGKLEIERLPFNTMKLVSSVASQFQMQMEEKNLDFVVDVSQLQHEMLISDAYRIKQIANNLLSNAFKFTETGQVKFSVSSYPVIDEIKNSKTTANLVLSVVDTGIGMTKQQQEKLFTPFNQADSSVARRFGGTGLGLTISRHLAQMMNGNITVKSEERIGTTFTAELTLDIESSSVIVPSRLNIESKLFSLLLPPVEAKLFKHHLTSLETKVNLLKPNELATVLDDDPDYLICDINLLSDPIIEWLVDYQKVLNCHIVVLQDITEKRVLPETLNVTLWVRPVILPVLLKTIVRLSDDMFDQEQQENPNIDNMITELAHNKVIVIADDNEVNRIVAIELLQTISESIQIVEAVDGKDVLKVLKGLEPELSPLVLMDCQMPEMSGYEATELIRAGECGAHLKQAVIIAMTADVMDTNQQLFKQAGMDDFIPKPLDFGNFKLKLSKWLAHIDQKMK